MPENVSRPLSGSEMEKAHDIASRLERAIHGNVVGKDDAVRLLVETAISGGHALVEGVPGIAKTLLAKTVACALGLEFSRIQFTPDLLPSDLTGTPVYDPRTLSFFARKGPLFAGVVLADEINRAPAKVQSALLEAMEERQVTLGDETLPLPFPFFVVATQNPIEHEGTYRLPEAELDRFTCKTVLDYPSEREELDVVTRSDTLSGGFAGEAIGVQDLEFLVSAVRRVRVADEVAAYAVALARATRPARGKPDPKVHPALAELHRFVDFGASPRAAISLFRLARAKALLEGRDYALPDDVKSRALSALRHRVLPNYEADAAGLDADAIVGRLLTLVKVP